jgi:hypothetical protein
MCGSTLVSQVLTPHAIHIGLTSDAGQHDYIRYMLYRCESACPVGARTLARPLLLEVFWPQTMARRYLGSMGMGVVAHLET